jgi:hypothetical protein
MTMLVSKIPSIRRCLWWVECTLRPGIGRSALSASFVTFSYAAGLSYLKQTDGNFDYLDPARFLPSSLQGCADHACDAGR